MHVFLKQRYIKLANSPWQQLRNKTIVYINPINFDFLRSINIPENLYYRVDGIFTTLIFRRIFRLDKISPESFDYSSVAGEIFKIIANKKLKVNLIGGTSDDIDKFIKNLISRYPDIRIGFSMHGYDSEHRIIEYIKAHPADVNILGLGSPKQEKIAVELCRSNIGGTILCCGGFLSQTASACGDFYPPLVVALNIRWIYRIYKKPTHIFRFTIYPLFLLKCILFAITNMRKNL